MCPQVGHREMTGAWTVGEGGMVQSVRWMEGDAHRDGDASSATGEVRWESRWRAGDGSVVPVSHRVHI